MCGVEVTCVWNGVGGWVEFKWSAQPRDRQMRRGTEVYAWESFYKNWWKWI